MPTETNVQADINYEVAAFSDWSTAHTGSINAQNAATAAATNEAAKLSVLTGSLVKLFIDATTVVANKLLACSQDPRALLEPVFSSIVPPLTGTV